VGGQVYAISYCTTIEEVLFISSAIGRYATGALRTLYSFFATFVDEIVEELVTVVVGDVTRDDELASVEISHDIIRSVPVRRRQTIRYVTARNSIR
jgi:hypothetical protein